MVTDPESIFTEIAREHPEYKIDDSVKQALLKDISRRMTPQPLKIRADIELTCFEGDGVENIKNAMRKAEGLSTESCKVKVSLLASPLYVITTQTLEKDEGLNLVEAAIQAVQVSAALFELNFI